MLLAVLIGVSLGLLGSGGSIVTLPVLVYVAGVPTHQAVPMSLVIVGVTAGAGSVLLGRRHGIDGRAAAAFALTGSAGAFLGAHLTALVAPEVLLLCFAGIMIAAGTGLLARPSGTGRVSASVLPRCLAAGTGVGFLTGFLGVGGGFLIVPALLLFAGLDMKRAVPTSLVVIACNAAGGLAGQVRAVPIDWPVTAGFLAAALLGMAGGAAVAGRVVAATLQRVFAWSIVGLGAAIAAWNAAVLTRGF
jgi:hypothetical protein